MGTCARFVCVFTLLATSAAAQSTTEDGIRAMLRGDYRAAARILRPLADDAARPDPVAQFFVAMLYDTGQGVERDEARACGLFLRAAGGAHPFSEQAAAIGAFKREQLGDAASLLCVAEESWQGGPPQSYSGPTTGSFSRTQASAWSMATRGSEHFSNWMVLRSCRSNTRLLPSHGPSPRAAISSNGSHGHRTRR